MKEPKRYHPDEKYITPFIVAADTYTLRSACDLLFINGNDLTWGQSKLGFYLASITIDDGFEEVEEVADARSRLSFIQLASKFFPRFIHSTAEMVADAAPSLEEQSTDEQKRIITAEIASQCADRSQSQFDDLIPEVLDQWMQFANGIASWFARGAISLRQRQLATTGMSVEQYEDMVYALQSFELAESVIRIAYPERGFQAELSLASGGDFRVTEVQEGAQFIEVFRLSTILASLKRGQDDALAIFIAGYINQHYIGPPQAFSCASYGEQSGPEFDVVIPALNIGFEVKLYLAPFAQVESKLAKSIKDLGEQLKGYCDVGCKTVYYVSNLTESLAEHVLSKINTINSDVEVIPVAGGVTGGMEALLPVLNEIIKQLEDLREENIEKEIHSRIANSKRKKRKNPVS